MKTHKLGSSDLTVSMCCLGTMTWGEQNTKEEAFEQLDYALAHGVNFIDTAEVYPVPVKAETQSTTESIIGEWLESRGVREKVVLASKVCGPISSFDRNHVLRNRIEGKPEVDGQPDLTAKQIKEAVEGSLRRLRTTYLDVYQIHWPARYVPLWGSRQYQLDKEKAEYVSFEEQVTAMGELIAEGKIKTWGLSNETTYGVVHMCETAKRLGVPLPVSIQNDFALVTRQFEQELAEACSPSAYNVGLLAYGPLAGGTLAGKYLGGQTPENSRHSIWPAFQGRYHWERTMAAAARYAELAHKIGTTPTKLALAWCASRWYMGSVIIGATTMAQLKENIEAFELELDEETLKAIDAIHLDIRNPTSGD